MSPKRPELGVMFLETQLDSSLTSDRSEIRFMRELFEDLAVEIIFLSCCRLGQDQAVMRRLLDVSGALAVFSYTRDVDDYQAFITESLFYHLAYGFVRGERSELLLEEVYEKVKFTLDYLGIDRTRRPLADPLVAAVFAPRPGS